MSPRILLLALSLLANAALLGAYLMSPAEPTPARTTADSTAAAASQPPSRTPATATAASSAAAKAATTTLSKAGFSWSAIETEDLDELVRRLKAAGFTPREIRIVMRDVINRRWNPSIAGQAGNPPPYWRATRSVPLDAKSREEQRKRDVEYARLSRKYTMGPDTLADDPESLDFARRRWGDLPFEKLHALATIEDDYDELQTQFADHSIRPGEESNGMAVALMMEKERMAEIAMVLTPEELTAFELRSSMTARMLRSRLEGFNATEAEYKAIYALSQPYTERLFDPRLGADGHKALQAEISAKVQELLGAERALDYDAVMNHNAQDQTGVLVARLGLPARVAVEVRQTQQDFTRRGKDIRANASLSPPDEPYPDDYPNRPRDGAP